MYNSYEKYDFYWPLLAVTQLQQCCKVAKAAVLVTDGLSYELVKMFLWNRLCLLLAWFEFTLSCMSCKRGLLLPLLHWSQHWERFLRSSVCCDCSLCSFTCCIVVSARLCRCISLFLATPRRGHGWHAAFCLTLSAVLLSKGWASPYLPVCRSDCLRLLCLLAHNGCKENTTRAWLCSPHPTPSSGAAALLTRLDMKGVDSLGESVFNACVWIGELRGCCGERAQSLA